MDNDYCKCVACGGEFASNHPSTRFVCEMCVVKARNFDEFEKLALTWKKAYEDLKRTSDTCAAHANQTVVSLMGEIEELREGLRKKETEDERED